MSSLTHLEKRTFESLLNMGGGYVLDFTDRSFATFFRDVANVNIYDDKYAVAGTSKAKRLRTFWETEPDAVVGKVLKEALAVWTFMGGDQKSSSYQASERAVARLLGQPSPTPPAKDSLDSEAEFLKKDLSKVAVNKLPLESSLVAILEARLKEITQCMVAGSPFAVVILVGSVLEGLLLGVAVNSPEKFNRSTASPKRDGKVLAFDQWTLANFIDVAHDVGVLKLDVKKFSHSVRDFRNYIHPYAQMAGNFAPDKHTAQICLQVLKAAIADINGERGS